MIIIPALSAGTDYAQELIAAHELPDDLTGSTITLYCRLMERSTTAFAFELVKEIVHVRHGRLILDGAPTWFQKWVDDAKGANSDPWVKLTLKHDGQVEIWTDNGMPASELADLLESMARQFRSGDVTRIS